MFPGGRGTLPKFRPFLALSVVFSLDFLNSSAAGVVLPGVGSFGKAMAFLDESGLRPALEARVIEAGRPLLGICLGFQMLTEHSEEGDVAGLGWVSGRTRRFDAAAGIKILHLGWNDLAERREGPIFKDIKPEACFYFAHSYYVECDAPEEVLARTDYGQQFTSAVQKGHIFGTQFHPEKSHANGLRLIKNFLECVAHA